MFMLILVRTIFSSWSFENRLIKPSVASFLMDSKSIIKVLTLLKLFMHNLLIDSIVGVWTAPDNFKVVKFVRNERPLAMLSWSDSTLGDLFFTKSSSTVRIEWPKASVIARKPYSLSGNSVVNSNITVYILHANCFFDRKSFI